MKGTGRWPAAVAAITLLIGWAASADRLSAQSETAAPSQIEQLLRQKASMLLVYLNSDRVKDILAEADDEARHAIGEAGERLVAGVAALDEGRLDDAGAALDAGLQQVSSVVARTAAARATDPAAAKATYARRRRQIDSFIATIRGGAGLDGGAAAPWHGRLTVAERNLADADALFKSERYDQAETALGAVYREIVEIIGETSRGQSVVYRLEFETPADEYAYELERNRSYEMLVEIAVAERDQSDRDMQPYINSLVAQSRAIRREAEAQAEADQHVAAIGSLERATKHLVNALRAAGVMTPE